MSVAGRRSSQQATGRSTVTNAPEGCGPVGSAGRSSRWDPVPSVSSAVGYAAILPGGSRTRLRGPAPDVGTCSLHAAGRNRSTAHVPVPQRHCLDGGDRSGSVRDAGCRTTPSIALDSAARHARASSIDHRADTHATAAVRKSLGEVTTSTSTAHRSVGARRSEQGTSARKGTCRSTSGLTTPPRKALAGFLSIVTSSNSGSDEASCRTSACTTRTVAGTTTGRTTWSCGSSRQRGSIRREYAPTTTTVPAADVECLRPPDLRVEQPPTGIAIL